MFYGKLKNIGISMHFFIEIFVEQKKNYIKLNYEVIEIIGQMYFINKENAYK